MEAKTGPNTQTLLSRSKNLSKTQFRNFTRTKTSNALLNTTGSHEQKKSILQRKSKINFCVKVLKNFTRKVEF